MCDCGDPEAWTEKFPCKYAVCDTHEPTPYPTDITEDFKENLSATVGILLDYIIDVMAQSDLHFFSPWDTGVATYPEKYSANCMLDPARYGFADSAEVIDSPSEKYCLIVYNDQIRHFRDAVQRIHLASKKVPEFAHMIAERVQSHGRASFLRSRDVKLLLERQKILSSTGLASCIRNARDEFREGMCEEIVLWIFQLTERDYFKTSEPLKNVFCRSFCCKWGKGLLSTTSSNDLEYSKGKLNKLFQIPNFNCLDNSEPSQRHWSFAPSPWDADPNLCQECGFNQDLEEYHANGFIGTRFQYFVFLDIRFWRSVRQVLHDFYLSTLVTNLRYKKLFACQYVDIYPAVVDMFLTIDGEPEVNILSKLSSQLYTCPSNSSSIIAHGDVSRIFSTIYNFLKTGVVKAMPSTAANRHNISLLSLKNRRWGQIFFDIGYILSRGRDRELILTQTIIPMVCDILALFQGKPVMKREKASHVEYESSDYTAFFHAILVIYQFAEYISQCVTNLTGDERESVSRKAISYVIQFLLSLETKALELEILDNNDVDYGQVCDESLAAMDDELKFSFLHPVHSFLSWLIEFSNFRLTEQLQSIVQSTIDQFLRENSDFGDLGKCLFKIFEYPIRTIVLSSQIKAGYWVRNGFSIRSQLQLYKNTSLREQGYLRDLFLIQVFCASSQPDKVMRDMLFLWRLELSFDPESSSCAYELNVLPYMIEECLSFFIHLLSEDMFLKGATTEETAFQKIKDEIVHNLYSQPMSYSRLCSLIPEHISTDKKFDSVLEKVTIYKKPNTTKDSGTYVLKAKYLDEVNPYYFNYTTNKKDEAISFVKDRLHKSLNKSKNDTFIQPKSLHGDELGCFKHIGNFTISLLFNEFLVKTLKYIETEGIGKMDGIFETTLHLIHTATIEQLVENGKRGIFFENFFRVSSIFETSLAQQLYSVLSDEQSKKHHAKIRAIFQTMEMRYGSLENVLQSSILNFDAKKLDLVAEDQSMETDFDRRKRAAKERQAKLLAKFKKQQSLFSKAHNVCVDGSDTEMEDIDEDGWRFPEPHCILCQDTAESAGPFGIITYISKASEFREVPFDDEYWFLKAFSDKTNLNGNPAFDIIPEHYSSNWQTYMSEVKENNVLGPGFADQKMVHSNLVSLTCGHGMHFYCYVQFLSSNKSRLSQITRNTPESTEHREFLCPLCKALNNMFIPILWTSNNRSLRDFVSPQSARTSTVTNPFDMLTSKTLHDQLWFKNFCSQATNDLNQFSILTSSAKEMIGTSSSSLSSSQQQQFRLLLTNMFQILSLLTFPEIFKADSSRTLTNSIKATEISLRGQSNTSSLVIYQLSNNSLINLRALNEFRLTSLLMKTTNWIQSTLNQPDAHIKMLAHLQDLSCENFDDSVLYSDFFEILVNNFPTPSNNFTFNTILRACFTGIVLQQANILMENFVSNEFYDSKSYSLLDIPFSELISAEDSQQALSFFHKIGSEKFELFPDVEAATSNDFGRVLFSLLIKSVTPFLRQAAIYSYVCCSNTEGLHSNDLEEIMLEADFICQFLQIPSLSSILQAMLDEDQNSWEKGRFASYISYQDKPNGKLHSVRKTMEYPGIISLAALPDRLDKFFTEYYYLDRHNNPHLSIENPAVCLFCSEVMDAQKGVIGSPYGQCSTHLIKECANNVGIFLLPKERCLLLLHKNGGTFYDAPFIDQHGELPAENKKLKPVFLLEDKYNDFIRSAWLQHNIPNLIVRKLDSVLDVGGWDTL